MEWTNSAPSVPQSACGPIGPSPSQVDTFDRKVSYDGMALQYPFSAIVGQDEMKRALLLAAIDPSIGGILVFGDRGTGKSTAVRGAGRPAAAHDGGGRLPLQLRSGRSVALLRPLPRAAGGGQAQAPQGSGAGHRPAARRDRGPRRRRARSRKGAGLRREGLRAGPAGARPSRLSLHRRGQPAGGPSGRPAARRRGIRRQHRRARGPERPPCRPLRAGRQRQSGGGRAAPAAARPFRPLGRGRLAEGHRRRASRW